MSDTYPTHTKQEMFTQMQKGLFQFLAVLDEFSDEQMLVPVDAVGWNVRDHVVHLAVWAEGIAALVRREDRWQAMGLVMENPDADDPDYDLINEQIAHQHRQITPAQARAWLVAAHERVANALETLTDDDLSAPYDRFVTPFTGNWGHPIAEYILGNTEDHYDEHTAWVRAIVHGN